jgi:hypothetical protein
MSINAKLLVFALIVLAIIESDAMLSTISSVAALRQTLHTKRIFNKRFIKNTAEEQQVEEATTTTFGPTVFPPPKFKGYFVLWQYRCMDLFCPNWSAGLTRLAYDCFSPTCAYEQEHLNELVPTLPRKELEFPVLVTANFAKREVYTIKVPEPMVGGKNNNNKKLFNKLRSENKTALVWSNLVDNGVSNATVARKSVIDLSNNEHSLVAAHAHPDGNLLLVFSDSSFGLFDPHTSQLTMQGFLLNSTDRAAGRFIHRATANTRDNKFAFFHVLNQDPQIFNKSTDPSWITFDIHRLVVVSHVRQSTLAYIDYTAFAFEAVWVEDVGPNGMLLAFTTGNFDGLYWLDVTTGNATWAAFDLANFQNGLEFTDSALGQFCSDFWGNAVYDVDTKTVYFQATQDQEGDTVTSVIYTPAIVKGQAPPAWDWLDFALQPSNFGYRGPWQYMQCVGPCPT